MTTYIIEKKPSGTGSIHDSASEHCDRDIKFRSGANYAVVLAAYYGDHYTTHRTAEAAIRESKRQREFSHAIIDPTGAEYEIVGDSLRRVNR